MRGRRKRLDKWPIRFMEGERDKDPTSCVADTIKRSVQEISQTEKNKYQMISLRCGI